MRPSNQEKFDTVIHRNTFFYYDAEFEETHESQNITSVVNLLEYTYCKVRQANGPTEEIYHELLTHPLGLKALLALTGVSNELIKRIITLIRVIDNSDLDVLVNRSQWMDVSDGEDFVEWGTDKIERLVRENPSFRKGLVNLFFRGSSDPSLSRFISPFHLKKFSISKLSFDFESMLDTLVRYREAGSRSARSSNNPERTIEKILGRLNISFETGDLPLLAKGETNLKRRMDFIIPNKQLPAVILECSYLTTTSSGQGDKSKTEQGVRNLIKKYYPRATFVGIVDGIGWYVRRRDLMRMVEAYDEVFTLAPEEQRRLSNWLIEKLS